MWRVLGVILGLAVGLAISVQGPGAVAETRSPAAVAAAGKPAAPMPAAPSEMRESEVRAAAGSSRASPVADRVLVIKSERRLYLLDGGKVFRAYDVALGFNPIGHKIHEGDGRTPEGVYTLGEALPESRFYRALPISYPSPEDKERARARGLAPGGRIMIHGLPPSGARMGRRHLYLDWTDGCVAVTNPEIDEIVAAVRPGTPIEIRP